MLINASSMKDLFSGYNVSFNKGLKNTVSHWEKIAMRVPSSGASEKYSWLSGIPKIREWLGDRIVNSLGAARYEIENREFEATVAVSRKNIEDDKFGIYGPMFESMGYDTARHPDELVFNLLGDGTSIPCYDGQYFFDADHVGYDENGNVVSVSNYSDGTDSGGTYPAWYLLDCSQPVRPLVYQERQPFQFESLTNPEDSHVFFKNEFVYGVRGRSNAGFGLWQMAYCSKEPLNAASYEAARNAMAAIRKPSGKPLGIVPTHLVIPTALEGNGRRLLNSALIDSGESNIWAGSAELIVSPLL